MLTPDDAQLVRHDRLLPGLPVLLDPEAFAESIRSHFPQTRGGSARPTYLRYKPGRSCLAAFQIEVDGRLLDVYGKAYRTEARDKLRKALAVAERGGSSGRNVKVDEDLALVVSLFPHDRFLGSLSLLNADSTRRSLFERLLPRHPGLWDARIERIRYKPERRFVSRIVLGDQSIAVLKLYTAPAYQLAQRNAKVVRSRSPLRVAQRIGRSGAHRAVAFEWIDGTPLDRLVDSADFNVDALATVGLALAELHIQECRGLFVLWRDVEAQRVRAMAPAIEALCPELSAAARRLAERLAGSLAGERPRFQTIHGDFDASQLLLSDGTVSILDMDRAAQGDPARDLGNFLAHLQYDVLSGKRDVALQERLARYLVDGYFTACDSSIAGRIELYTASSLFQLALEPFRSRQPNWRQDIEQLLDQVKTISSASPLGGLSPRSPSNTCRNRVLPGDSGGVGTVVVDPFQVTKDPVMPQLARAIDPNEARTLMVPLLERFSKTGDPPSLRAIRVVRYKPMRRCVVEYHFRTQSGDAFRWMGKIRAKGMKRWLYQLHESLVTAGFQSDSPDGISIPDPVGVVPELGMWLGRHVDAVPATWLLSDQDGVALCRKVAEGLSKLHSAGIASRKRHTLDDEMQILCDRMDQLAQARPEWSGRIGRLFASCGELASSIPAPQTCGIHRDFYADQILVQESRLFLVDFDLYCEGDPGLDAGNFLGHMIEQSLRMWGRADAFAEQQEAFRERFVQLSGEQVRPSMDAHTLLTLARHIYLSTQFSARRHTTPALLEHCEQQLAKVLE